MTEDRLDVKFHPPFTKFHSRSVSDDSLNILELLQMFLTPTQPRRPRAHF